MRYFGCDGCFLICTICLRSRHLSAVELRCLLALEILWAMHCFSCRSPDAEFECSRCRRVRFCSIVCQQKGWRQHKSDCRSATKSASTTSVGSHFRDASETKAAPVDGALVESPTNLLASTIFKSMSLPPLLPLRFTVYPNTGKLQGDVEVFLERGASFPSARVAVARSVLGGAEPDRVRMFAVQGLNEVRSLEDLRQASELGGVVATDGHMPRGVEVSVPICDQSDRRYDAALVGGHVARLVADDSELPRLLACPVPVVITSSGVAGRAPDLWSFDYLGKHLADVDNFFVLCAPLESKGRFGYYDLTGNKNPCGYDVTPSNIRVEMPFSEFRRKARESHRLYEQGFRSETYYLQNTLLHREVTDPGDAKPVGGFGSRCGQQVMHDIKNFRWQWLRRNMDNRKIQMCQLFCGMQGGFSPCHYDPQDNLFVQVRGWKRVLLFHPKYFGCLYAWPVHHPQDRQSRVDFESPDIEAFPRFAELAGCGLEAVLGPGDAIRIPPGWWHHIEMLPSPEGEVVSINFWYPAPQWYHGDLAKEETISWDTPVCGVHRVFFQRCIEELISKLCHPEQVPNAWQSHVPSRFAVT